MSDNQTNERNNSKLPSQILSPTGLGILISNAVTTKQNVEILQNSTLNERYGILEEESVGVFDGSRFQLGFYGIGIRGSRCTGEDANGLESRRVYQHSATDFNAFQPIPFIIREISADLDPESRKIYRMRHVRKIGDKTYAMYYLKLINFDKFKPSMKVGERDPETGNETERPYTPKPEDLTPTPYELLSINSIPITNQYINSTGTMDLSLNANELDEIKNVCRLLFNDASKAAINEMYLAYGIETRNDGPVEGGTINYQELAAACVAYHVTESYARDANTNTSMPWFFEYGNSIPFLVHTNLTSAVPDDSIP
jgi:hypothetical protein